MILHPALLAILLVSLLTSFMAIYAGYYGTVILRRWNPASGSEVQLELERRTCLVSAIMSYILCFELMSFFLFIYTADDLHTLFTGAMCAAGTLAVNSFGYPALLLKILNFLLSGVWLLVNYVDNNCYDYPMIRHKYRLLNIVVPLLLLESVLLFFYFTALKPDLITSCCGSLFSREASSFSGDLAALPHLPVQVVFFSAMMLTAVSGLFFYLKMRGGYLFSMTATVTFFISVVSIISFICLYFYELPTHHCPFCLLQKEYGYVGYVLYATLLGGAVAGISTGVLMPFRNLGSMAYVMPVVLRRLAVVVLVCYLLFSLVVVWKMVFSSLKLY